MTKLPSTIGEVTFSSHGITLHCAEATRFDPEGYRPYYSAPPEEPAARGPLPIAPVVPITLIPDTKFIPQNYVVHTSFQRCLHCGTVHESSVVYAYNNVPARMGMRSVSHLVPVGRFSYNVPIIVQRLPETTTPCCHECARGSMDLSHLPRPAQAEAYKRLLNPSPAPPTPVKSEGPRVAKSATGSKPPSKPKTIDDIFDQF